MPRFPSTPFWMWTQDEALKAVDGFRGTDAVAEVFESDCMDHGGRWWTEIDCPATRVYKQERARESAHGI